MGEQMRTMELGEAIERLRKRITELEKRLMCMSKVDCPEDKVWDIRTELNAANRRLEKFESRRVEAV